MESSKIKSSQPASPVQQVKRSQDSRQAQERNAKTSATVAKNSAYEQPKPTVNGQGQHIGGTLSVRA